MAALVPNVYAVPLGSLERTPGGGFVLPAVQQASVASNEVVVLLELVGGSLWRVMLGYAQLDGQGRTVVWPLVDREFVIA